MIDGVAVMVSLLSDAAAVTALVPPARIVAGVLPVGSALPGIALQSVSTVERNAISAEPDGHVTERVQATILARTYPEARGIVRALRKLGHSFPADAGLVGVAVLLDGAGPDFMLEEPRIYGATQDFRISYTETR